MCIKTGHVCLPDWHGFLKLVVPIADTGTGKQGFLYFAEGNVNWPNPFWKAFREIYLKALIMLISSHPPILSLRIYPKE